MSDPIRILLVDDHTVARNGMRLMLSSAPDLDIVAEAESASATLQLLRTQRFDVVLLDIGLPDKNGIELLKAVRERKPAPAVIMLSMYSEDIYAVRAFRQGAAGYLTKNSSSAMVISAVRAAAAGGKYVTPSQVEKLADVVSGTSNLSHDALSDRELEVFKLIAAGETLVNIGTILHVSPSTVTTYRARILGKMGLKTNADLTRYAAEAGLL